MATQIVADGQHNAFPGLVRTVTGKRILVYRKGPTHVNSKGSLVMRTAASQGAAWSAETTLYTDAGVFDARDPEIVEIATPSGMRLIVSFFLHNSGPIAGAVRTIVSDDDGVTWGAASPVVDGFVAWVACSAKVVQLPDGTLLLPMYGSDATAQLVEIAASSDYGATWTASRPWGTPNEVGDQEPNIVLMENGDLLMLMRTQGGNVFESVSTDNGLTWGTATLATPHTGRPHCLCHPDGRVGSIQRHDTNDRAVYGFRDAGSWGSFVNLDASLSLRMTYASSLIDEDGNWEIVSCQESGSVSDIYGLTISLPSPQIVLAQSPSAGSAAEAGDSVSLTMSPPPIGVQSFFGDSLARATMRINGAGLTVQ